VGKVDDEGNFSLPKGVFVAVLISVISVLAGGGFSLGVLYNTVSTQATSNERFQHDITARVERDEASSLTDSRERSTLMNSIDQRLTRIEAQINYAVTNLPSAKK
jgi:hypothetical protein